MKTILLLPLLVLPCFAQVGLRSPAFVANLHPQSLWTPTTPSTLVEWIKADAMVMSDSAAVATWTNSTGADFVQATGTKQPLFKTNVKNGLPVVRFDGVNDRLVMGAIGQEDQPYTVFIVFKLNELDEVNGSVIIDSQSSSTKRSMLWAHPAAHFYLHAGGGYGTTSVSTNTAWNIVKIEFNDASSKMRFNNGADNTVDTGIGTQATLGFTLGQYFDPGVDTYAAAVDIGELLIYSGTLSAGNVTEAFAYLNGRWAVY